jgi:hypothetical protein
MKINSLSFTTFYFSVYAARSPCTTVRDVLAPGRDFWHEYVTICQRNVTFLQGGVTFWHGAVANLSWGRDFWHGSVAFEHEGVTFWYGDVTNLSGGVTFGTRM